MISDCIAERVHCYIIQSKIIKSELYLLFCAICCSVGCMYSPRVFLCNHSS